MKILVIDDEYSNQQTAHQTLESHEVTICSSQDAVEKITGGYYAPEELQKFDVVLCDLMMAPSARTQARQPTGELMPVGFGLLLLTILRFNPKYAAIVTNTDHHSHPVAAQIDYLGNHQIHRDVEDWAGANFTINNTRVAFFSSCCIDSQVKIPNTAIMGKNWGIFLDILMGKSHEEIVAEMEQ